jgi:hypothetical protein
LFPSEEELAFAEEISETLSEEKKQAPLKPDSRIWGKRSQNIARTIDATSLE